MAVYITSFTPLSASDAGRAACAAFGYPPFIDGSCRREPDFEKQYPGITGLCRPGFAAKLNPGDMIIYTTNVKGIGARKVVAVLEVKEPLFADHLAAEQWYKQNNLPVPNNLMVPSTAPHSINQTHGLAPTHSITQWDAIYKNRASKYPEVAVCQVWRNAIFLKNPPVLSNAEMKTIFGKRPGTQNPAVVTDSWPAFEKWLLNKQH